MNYYGLGIAIAIAAGIYACGYAFGKSDGYRKGWNEAFDKGLPSRRGVGCKAGVRRRPGAAEDMEGGRVSLKVSENADRALLFLYILAHGLPEPESGQDQRTVQLSIFRKISGLSEYEALAAFAELEDNDFIGAD